MCRAEPWAPARSWVWGLAASRGDGAAQGVRDQPGRGELGYPHSLWKAQNTAPSVTGFTEGQKPEPAASEMRLPHPCSP